MLVKQPKYRKQLSKNQLVLLGLICKFRFVTVPLVSEWRGKDKSTIYERLLVLTEQGYIHMLYEKSYKLLGKPAIYTLTAKGIRALRDSGAGFSELVYKNQYKNSSASSQLADHSLDVFKLCLQLKTQYPEALDLFSKAEMTKFDAFLRPLSDVFIRSNTNEDATKYYLLETIEAGTLTWIIRKRINAHQEWYDENNEEGWEFEDNYPTLLLVCDNTNTEKRIHRLTDDSIFDFDVMTTTRERFESNDKQVWLAEWDEDVLKMETL